jgi:hypothetical protein
MDESMNLEADQRANRRVWWGLATLFGVVFGGAVGFYLLYDVSAPDPASYGYDFKESASGENAFSVFERDTDTIRNAMREDWTKLIAENDRLHAFELGCEEALRAHVEAHREFVERFQRLVREAKRPLAYPGVNAELTLMTPSKSVSVLLDGAGAWQRAIQLSALTGDTFGASGQAVELTEFAKELSECDSTLIHWLVMVTMQTIGLQGLEKALQKGELPKEVSLEYRQRLQAAELIHADFARCVRVEMWVQAGTLAKLAAAKGKAQRDAYLLSVSGASNWFQSLTFKPNLTILENVHLVSPIAQGLAESWARGMAAAQEAERLAKAMSDRGKWKNWLHPNFTGRTLIETSFSAWDGIIQRTMQSVVLNRCLQCVLALRAFEMDEGRLPESLDVLVPKYLPVVPEDPFSGAALRWNPQTDRIYSVGGDGRDDGGDFDPSRNMKKQKDWGLVYPRP